MHESSFLRQSLADENVRGLRSWHSPYKKGKILVPQNNLLCLHKIAN